ncbi:MAG: hypothetical protein HOQ24_16670 [Mycobacteriaceae bacterium]|nr:hypothetical protein [Mycobacteriaceae bacterium]
MSHRVESMIHAGILALIALALPVAAAIGTSTYTSRVEQTSQISESVRQMDAVVDITPHAKDAVLGMVSVPVHWTLDDRSHSGATMADASVKQGDSVLIWVGPDGEQAAKPPSRTEALPDAIAVAVGCFGLFTAVMLTLWHGAGRFLDHLRWNDWSREWAALAVDRKWNHL